MEVPRRYIDGYDDAMRAVVADIQNELRASLSLVDYSRPVAEVRAEVVALMDAYCDAAASAGARISSEFYGGLRQIVAGKDGALSLQTGRNRAATEGAVRAFIDRLLEGDVEGFEDLLMERVELECKRAAAYNTIDNVRRDPDEPRFARVPQGERTCDFCLMLASRGPVYLTEESAGAFVKYHAHCDCKVVPFWHTVADGASRRRSIDMSIEGYDPDALYDQYQELMKDPHSSFSNRMARGAETAKARRKAERNGGGQSADLSVGAMRYRDNRSSNVILHDQQFGHKATKHCKDWGLDPSSQADRDRLKDIIATIIDQADEIVVGTTWRDQPQPCTFYRKDNDVVVVNANDEYVTILKDGATSNRRFNTAREEAQK